MPLRAICLDLAGVLYQGPRLLPGAQDALQRLRATGLPLRFVTNTSQRNRSQILSDLFTAPQAAHDYLTRRGLTPYCLFHPNLEEEFSDLEGKQPDAVLIGDAGRKFTYEHLDQAFRLLHDGAPLIAIGENRYYQLDDGLHLDAGPFVRALEYAANCKAIITGKPSPAFFEQVLADLGTRPEYTLMVGDDVHGDVEGALNSGMQACLVQTGKYRAGDEKAITGKFQLESDIRSVAETVINLLG